MGTKLSTSRQEAEGTGWVPVSSGSSNFDTSPQAGDWVVVSGKNAGKDSGGDGGDVLNFNPSTSRAVCAGVGYFLKPVLTKRNLGEAADKDPLRFDSVLRETLGLTPDHVTTLSSKSPENAATLPNIVDFLTKAAGEVGEDGLLFFSFSGHSQVKTHANDRKSTILITADSYYDGLDTKSVSAKTLEDCLKDTKAKYVLIMLDCCHAGMLANSLAEDSMQTHAQLYVLAACSKSEFSMGDPQLASGIFTFFVTEYLARHAERGQLPISSVLQHTQTLCPAVVSLCVPSKREMTQMSAETGITINPLLIIKRPHSVRSGQESYSLNPPLMFESDSELTANFLSRFDIDAGSQVDDRVTNIICDWLMMVAMPAIQILYRHGYLSPCHREYEKVLKTVVSLLSRTMASMSADIGSGNADDPGRFLDLVFYVRQAIVQAVDDEAKERQGANPDVEKPTIVCSHARLSLQYYLYTMAKELACEQKELVKLYLLLTNMSNHMKEADKDALRRASSTRQHPVSSGAESASLPTMTTVAAPVADGDQPNSACSPERKQQPMTNIEDAVEPVKKTLDDIPRLDDVIHAFPNVECRDTFSPLE